MRFVDRGVPSNKEDVMGVKVIGVDPHKRSHTAVVLDDTRRSPRSCGWLPTVGRSSGW